MLRKQQARQFQRVLAAIQDLCWEPTGLLSLFPEMGFLIPFYTHTHTHKHTQTPSGSPQLEGVISHAQAGSKAAQKLKAAEL